DQRDAAERDQQGDGMGEAHAQTLSEPRCRRRAPPDRVADDRRISVVPAKAGTQGHPLDSRFRAGLSGENICALQTSPREELLNPPPSCPALCRASTLFSSVDKTWMAGTSPAMTMKESLRQHIYNLISFPGQPCAQAGTPGKRRAGGPGSPLFAGTTR